MKFKYILSILLITICYLTNGQILKININDRLESNASDFRSALINGKIAIEDIFFPDEQFNCLDILGEPLKVEKDLNDKIGNSFKYYFDGLILEYSEISDYNTLSLIYMEMTNGNSFLFFPKEGVRLMTEKPINSMISSDQNSRMENKLNENLSVSFPDDEGARMEYSLKSSIITQIRIWW